MYERTRDFSGAREGIKRDIERWHGGGVRGRPEEGRVRVHVQPEGREHQEMREGDEHYFATGLTFTAFSMVCERLLASLSTESDNTKRSFFFPARVLRTRTAHLTCTCL